MCSAVLVLELEFKARCDDQCAMLQRCSRWRCRPLVVVVDVLYSGFALLDESVALVSLD